MNPQQHPHSGKPPIGVFDSGVGGLSVLDKLVAVFPDRHFVYFGDTLHMPYGTKTPAQITELARGSIRWLAESVGSGLIVTACNTSAATLYGTTPTSVPLVWTMSPVCRWIAQESGLRRVGVIATPLTVASGIYTRLMREGRPEIETLEIPCPKLAALIEQGKADSPETREALQEYLAPFLAWEPEAVIFGCTHYPFADGVIRDLLPPDVRLLDPADYISREAEQHLGQSEGLTVSSPPVATVDYYVSAEPERFVDVVSRLPLQHLRVDLPTVVEVNPATLESHI